MTTESRIVEIIISARDVRRLAEELRGLHGEHWVAIRIVDRDKQIFLSLSVPGETERCLNVIGRRKKS